MSQISPDIYKIQTKGPGPTGALPLTAEMLTEAPSGDIFGWYVENRVRGGYTSFVAGQGLRWSADPEGAEDALVDMAAAIGGEQ